MIILGLNAYHADAAACLVIDGQLVAAAEEERFSRIKHWAGLPTEAVRTCLKQAGVSVPAIDHIAINRNPGANLLKKALYAFAKRPGFAAVRDRLKNAAKVHDVRKELEDDRKSTRLNSSHSQISYAVFCLKKKKKTKKKSDTKTNIMEVRIK